MINLNSEALVNSIDPRSKSVIDQERKNEIKLKSEELMKNEKKKNKMRLSHKEKHDEILKNFDRHQQKRNRLRVLMENNHEKIKNEKSQVSDELKVLNKIQDSFDPELYLNDDEEMKEDISNYSDDDE